MKCEHVITWSAARAIRRSTAWMCDCGCLSTHPWWRPYSVACTVTSHGTRRRRASDRAAAATSQSCEWTRSKPPPSSAPAASMSSFMCSTHAMNASRSSFGKSGSRTRCTDDAVAILDRLQPPAAAGDDVHLVAVAHELLGQLAHVPREAALDDRRVLPRQGQNPHGLAP